MSATRMDNIRLAAEELAQKLCSPCPACDAPGFWIDKRLTGLPCKDCGAPTRVTRAEAHGCLKCAHRITIERTDREYADPGRCDYCNPLTRPDDWHLHLRDGDVGDRWRKSHRVATGAFNRRCSTGGADLDHSRVNGKQRETGHASNPSGKTQAVAASKTCGGRDFLEGAAMHFSNALNHLMTQAQAKSFAFKGNMLPSWR